MATTTTPDQQAASAPKKVKRTILMVLVILLVAGAAAGGMYFFLKSAGVGGQHTEAKAAEPAPAPAPVFFAIEPMTVNLLSDDGSQHYLRVGLSLKVGDEKAREHLTESLPEVRSRVLLTLSNKHPEELATLENKQALSIELKGVIQKPAQPGGEAFKVQDVLFTEFVVQ